MANSDEPCISHRMGGKNRVRAEAGSADRVLADLAEGQHGVVARRQLLALGVSGREIETRLQRHRIHRVHQGVYAVGYRGLTVRGRWMAAVLAAGAAAALSHRSAAALWGLLPPSTAAIEVTRPPKFGARPRIHAHESLLPDDERTVVDGIPVTTVPRTILDLAAAVSKRQLERAFNEVEVRGLTDRLSIPDLLARYPRRRGSAVLRALLDEGAAVPGVTQNDFEELFVALLDLHRLPRPRFNADLFLRGRFFSVDCLWPDEQLIVELDGRAVHRTRRAFEADRERDRLLLVEGWRVMRVTWRQLREKGGAIAADLRRALERG